MRPLLVLPYYVTWHYSRALKGIVDITNNLIWFLWHFFSIGLLASTLLSPWQRLQEVHKRGLDIEGFISTAIVNFVMRCVGIIIRTLFIVIGLIAIILTIVLGIVVFLIWLVLPAAIIFMFTFGFILLFKV